MAGEHESLWYKAHADDYTNPEAQHFLDWCENQRIPELAAIGFIEKIRRSMMCNGSGRLTAREIRNLASKGVCDVVYSDEGWKEWLEMAVHYNVLEVVNENLPNGDSFTFYVNSSVRSAYERMAETAKQRSEAGKASAEKRESSQKKRDEKNAKRRAKYRENKDKVNVLNNGQRAVERAVERPVKQIID